MDFTSMLPAGLGFEFMTPVGKLIEAATSENLVSANWGMNLQICDEVGALSGGSANRQRRTIPLPSDLKPWYP